MIFIVEYEEQLRNGRERYGKIFDTEESALEYINKLANGFFGSNLSFRMYECGKPIPLHAVEKKEKQPANIRRTYTIRK